MCIELNKVYAIGPNKTIEPIALLLEKINGFKLFSCQINRGGAKSTCIYHSLHIQTLIKRYENRQ